MQGIMGLSAGAKEEVCSLQAKTDPQVGKPGREQPCTPCRTSACAGSLPSRAIWGMPALSKTLMEVTPGMAELGNNAASRLSYSKSQWYTLLVLPIDAAQLYASTC